MYDKEFDLKMLNKFNDGEDFTCEEYEILIKNQPYKNSVNCGGIPVIVIGNKIIQTWYDRETREVIGRPYECFEKTTVIRNKDGSLIFFSSLEPMENLIVR